MFITDQTPGNISSNTENCQSVLGSGSMNLDMSDVTDAEILLNAVRIRLGLIASASPIDRNTLRETVLQCVQALERLQAGMSREMEKNQQLQDEILDTKNALARAREAVVDLRGGQRRASHRATHDGLTLLPNRDLFSARLVQAIKTAFITEQALAVVYLDLDGFKQVNDLHGHAAGDQLLRVVAARLNYSVRVEDVVSRLGGDEFACILGGFSSHADLSQIAAKLFVGVSGACRFDEGEEVMVNPSIGIALWPLDGDTPERLVKNADAAMYRAKRTRTGIAFFDPAQDIRQSARTSL